jgi:hypothetical protein
MLLVSEPRCVTMIEYRFAGPPVEATLVMPSGNAPWNTAVVPFARRHPSEGRYMTVADGATGLAKGL